MKVALVKAEPQPPPLLENIMAPEIFASSVASFTLNDGILTIVLGSLRFDNSAVPAERKLVVIGRVSMPISGAHTLTVGLHNFLEQHGLKIEGTAERAQMQ